MPIFIVGFARSGTTLCQSLVSQTLGVPTFPETHFFERLESFEPIAGFLKPASAHALVNELLPFLKIDVQALAPLLCQQQISVRALFLQLIAQQLGSRALAEKGLWLEKTPDHVMHLERIVEIFPKARFIWMVRNPVLAFASRRELMAPGKGWGEVWKPIDVLCALWARQRKRVQNFEARHPGRLLTLRLEDLAAQPEDELARVRAFVGPAFAQQSVVPSQQGMIRSFEIWKQDALRPANSAIARREGKSVLDAFETWRVGVVLGDDMSSLGYEVDRDLPLPLDDLHQRLLASIDWYREHGAQRDALVDSKSARIGELMEALAAQAKPRRRAALSAAAVPGGPQKVSLPTLTGISGVNDNAEEFAAYIASVQTSPIHQETQPVRAQAAESDSSTPPLSLIP